MLLIIGVIFFAIKGMLLTSLLILVLTIIAGSIKIHGLTISEEKISVRRYSAFGFIKRELIIPRKKLKDIEFWEHGNLANTSSTDTWLDIFFIPALFVAGKKGITLKDFPPESEIKSLKLYIDNEECQLIEKLRQ